MLITGGARAGKIEGVALEDLSAAEQFKRFWNNRFPINIGKTQSMVWPATQAPLRSNFWVSSSTIGWAVSITLMRFAQCCCWGCFLPSDFEDSDQAWQRPLSMDSFMATWSMAYCCGSCSRMWRSLLRLQAITSSTHCRPMLIFSGLKILTVHSHYIYSPIVYVKRNVQELMTREISG